MKWQHKRNRTTAQAKKDEPDAGTNWSFVAASMIAA
jgi:hypothetical protein